jgi:hypothetical protein
MLWPLRIAACLGAAAQLACASGAPRVEFDATHDWSLSASWDWLPQSPERPQHADVLLAERLGSSIERELAERGLSRSPGPDLLVACSIALTREQVLRTEQPASEFLASMHGGSPSYLVSASQKRWVQHENAQLAIEIFDAPTRELLWRGILEQRVRGSFAERADAAVAAILESFPPPAESLLSARREPASAAAAPGTLP